MRRLAPIAVLAAAALLSASPAVAQVPRLAAQVTACATGPDAADRYATFSGSMPREGATAMAMRFDLYERVPGARYKRVKLARWGEWERTDRSDVPGFVFTKRVEQLAAPARFRARVSFRWYDARGRVVRTTRRTTRACRQPDWRPDLHLRRVAFPNKRGPTRVVIVNRGRGDAGAFAVEVSRGEVVRTATVDALAGRRRTTVSVPLGRCRPGETVTVSIDPANQVDEARETDGVSTVLCPERRRQAPKRR